MVFLALSIAMTSLWLNRANQDLLLKQKEIREQNLKQFMLLNNLFKNRFETWVELFVQMNTSPNESVSSVANKLETRMAYMQFNWQIEQVWLFDREHKPAYSTTEVVPEHVRLAHDAAIEQQSSVDYIRCEDQCYQYLTLPILMADDEVVSIAISYSLVETLAFLHQSTQASLAQVYIDSDNLDVAVDELKIRGPLARVQRELIGVLLSGVSDNKTMSHLVNIGQRISVNDIVYYVVLIPISTQSNGRDFLLFAHDITPLIDAHFSYQRNIIVIVFAVFGVAMLLLYFTTNNIRLRLMNLASRLPLLALRQYGAFKRPANSEKHRFRDELDVLKDAARELAAQLEKLDGEVATKTSELEYIAMYDQLTKLPNRNKLMQELEFLLSGQSNPFSPFALLFFDLDDFKKVNDSYGHSIGDELLIEASLRIAMSVADRQYVFRIGGDEFAILLLEYEDNKQVLRVAERLLERFRQPINVESMRFYVSTSIGIAYANRTVLQPNDLLRQADVAVYQAKQKGGNLACVYDDAMSQHALDKVALEDEARDALVQDHFSFALQPQINLQTNKLMGFEALLRWHHPLRGFISPGHFIPILENTEFMLTLGYWCIERAYSLLQEFEKRGYGDIKIAINLAGIQFLDPDLIPYLDEKNGSSGVKASKLELELTERTLVSDIQQTSRIMKNLVSKGFLLSIDDFGTGYSSLSYLKDMPAHYIKIDRSFIDGMMSNNADKQIVESIIHMVQNLGMQVIAEGIEQQEQVDILRQFGCNEGQGYYIARPIPQDELFERLAEKYINGIWQYES